MTMIALEYALYAAFFIAVLGFVVTFMIERYHLMQHKVPIKSKNVSQYYIDSLDYTYFRFGRHRLCIGDEVKIMIKGETFIGVLLGAKRKEGLLCILTKADEVKEFSVKAISKFKVIHRYGRLF